MVETHCQQCSHKWDYTGESDTYCTCPSCRTSVKVGRQVEGEEKGEEEVQEGPQEMREPQVVLQSGSIEREVPVTDAVAEVHGRVQDVGSADEIRRQQVEQMGDELAEVREQVREVATVFKDFLESFEDGEVEYETIDLGETESDPQVTALAERVRSGELSVTEALAQVDDGGATYDPTEEFTDG